MKVGDALAVLDALHVDSTNFWGYSMGGVLGFGLAKHAPERIRSLILGGTSPYADTEPITNPPDPLLQIMRNGVRDGPDAVVQGIRDLFGEITHTTRPACAPWTIRPKRPTWSMGNTIDQAWKMSYRP